MAPTDSMDSSPTALAAILCLLEKFHQVLVRISSTPDRKGTGKLRKQKTRGRDAVVTKRPKLHSRDEMARSYEKLVQKAIRERTQQIQFPELQGRDPTRVQKCPRHMHKQTYIAPLEAIKEELQERRRTIAKTPVRFIGQLERMQESRRSNYAEFLAQQYQNILPERAYTPAPAFEPRAVTSHQLRKIQCQVSLRDLMKEQVREGSNGKPETPGSECETLVGGDSPDRGQFWGFEEIEREEEIASYRKLNNISFTNHDSGIWMSNDDLERHICNSLSPPSVVKQDLSRCSQEELLLMMEAYETGQHNFRESRMTNAW
jgi:hypothetical protein